jgi:hypothetical protein
MALRPCIAGMVPASGWELSVHVLQVYPHTAGTLVVFGDFGPIHVAGDVDRFWN